MPVAVRRLAKRRNHAAAVPFSDDMIKIEEQLAAIGFAQSRPIDCGWRTVRLERPAAAAPSRGTAPESTCSRALLRWRDRLRRSAGPSPYRISRA